MKGGASSMARGEDSHVKGSGILVVSLRGEAVKVSFLGFHAKKSKIT